MDAGDLQGLATVLCMMAFAAVVYWAYGPSRKAKFEDAATLPFADEPAHDNESGSKDAR